ncbi:hypothetical protein BC829DRAFT_395237, partial [Chytridium lagenaria]
PPPPPPPPSAKTVVKEPTPVVKEESQASINLTSSSTVTKTAPPTAAETSKATVPFDQVMNLISGLPPPTAAPRSARTLKKANPETSDPVQIVEQVAPKVKVEQEVVPIPPPPPPPSATVSEKEQSITVVPSIPIKETPPEINIVKGSNVEPVKLNSDAQNHTTNPSLLMGTGLFESPSSSFSDPDINAASPVSETKNLKPIEVVAVVAEAPPKVQESLKSETVPFDAVMNSIGRLPIPMASSLSAESLKRANASQPASPKIEEVKLKEAPVEKAIEEPSTVASDALNLEPVSLKTVNVEAPKETISFDQVMSVLSSLPAPTPAPRSGRTLKRDVEAKSDDIPVASTITIEEKVPVNGTSVAVNGTPINGAIDPMTASLFAAPRSPRKPTPTQVFKAESPVPVRIEANGAALPPENTVPFDQVISILNALPAPTPAPRSARTLKRDAEVKPEPIVEGVRQEIPLNGTPIVNGSSVGVNGTPIGGDIDPMSASLFAAPRPPRKQRPLESTVSTGPVPAPRSARPSTSPVSSPSPVPAPRSARTMGGEGVAGLVAPPRSGRTVKKDGTDE